MSELVNLRTDGDVAVITIDNPPVNAMKHEVRAGLLTWYRGRPAMPTSPPS